MNTCKKLLLGLACLMLFASVGRAQLSFGLNYQVGGSVIKTGVGSIIRSSFGPSMLADVRFAQNFYFQSKTDPYVSINFYPTLSPSNQLLHTWSLGLANPLSIGWMNDVVGFGVGPILGIEYFITDLPVKKFAFGLGALFEVNFMYSSTNRMLSTGVNYYGGFMMGHVRVYFNYPNHSGRRGSRKGLKPKR